MIQHDRDEKVQNMQDNLWIEIADNDVEKGQRQDFNGHKLIQEECLRSFDMTDNK